MARRAFKVAGLGEGRRARKAVDLALTHPEAEVTSIDSQKKSIYGRYLLERGERQKPAGLAVLANTDALKFLRSRKRESLDHLYAHFLLQHLSFAQRRALLSEALRVLRKGARLAVVEEMHYASQLGIEMQKAGFRVFQKRMSARELLKLGTDNADMNAATNLERQRMMAQFAMLPKGMLERLQPKVAKGKKARNVEELKQIDTQEVREIIRQRIEAREGKKPSPEVRQAIGRILGAVGERYSEKPFVVLWARKPRTASKHS